MSQEAVWIDRRQYCPFSFQHGHAESPQEGYLISLCCCLFSCRMIGGVLKKKKMLGGFSQCGNNTCSLYKNSNAIGIYYVEIGKSI